MSTEAAEPTCHNPLDECGWWDENGLTCQCGTFVVAIEPDRLAQMSDAEIEAEDV